MKILPAGSELFHAEQTDRHDGASSHIFAVLQTHLTITTVTAIRTSNLTII
jgi:hypothetical protein